MTLHFRDASGKSVFALSLPMKHLAEGFLVNWHGTAQTQLRKLPEDFDLDNMELIRGEHVDSESFREFRQDVVWRLPRRGGKEGEDLYSVVMPELQSTVDQKMAVRVRTYVDMIYLEHLKHRKKSSAGGPPPVLPIVIYTGKTPWWAPTSVADVVRWDALPKEGGRGKADRERETAPESVDARRRHAAVESAVNHLERHGLDRVRSHGADGFARTVALSVVAANFHRLGRVLIDEERRKRKRPRLRAA